MKYLSVYTNNPTAAGTDGTVVSEDGVQTSPISVTLDASSAEAKTIKCALRAADGYATTGDTVISFSGDTNNHWSIGLTESGDFATSLTISESIVATNTIFYLKATSSTDEDPMNDISVSLNVSATIKAA